MRWNFLICTLFLSINPQENKFIDSSLDRLAPLAMYHQTKCSFRICLRVPYNVLSYFVQNSLLLSYFFFFCTESSNEMISLNTKREKKKINLYELTIIIYVQPFPVPFSTTFNEKARMKRRDWKINGKMVDS